MKSIHNSGRTFYSWIIPGILVIIILFVAYKQFTNKPAKIVSVDITKIFNEFNMKKELQGEYNNMMESRKRIVDTLNYSIKVVEENISNTDKKDKNYENLINQESELLGKKDEIEKANVSITDEFDNRIWKRLNHYLQEFSRENGYDFILGSKGDVSFVAGNKKYDVTEKAISYVNQKYAGDK